MRKTLNRIIIAWFALCANYLVSAQKKSSTRRDDRKLGIAHCESKTNTVAKSECRYLGSWISCPSHQRKAKEGWCGWGGRMYKCYEEKCDRCIPGYYKENDRKCNTCTPVDNCDIDSTTCTSSASSVCESCNLSYYRLNGQCSECSSNPNPNPIKSFCDSCESGYFDDDNVCTKCEQTTPTCSEDYLICTNKADSKCGCQIERDEVPERENENMTFPVDIKFNQSHASTFVCELLWSAFGIFDKDGDFSIKRQSQVKQKEILKGDCIYTATNTTDISGEFGLCGHTATLSGAITYVTRKQCQQCAKSIYDNCPFLEPFENKKPLHYFKNELEGCTNEITTSSKVFSYTGGDDLKSPDFLSNFLGFKLEYFYSFSFTVSENVTKPLKSVSCDDYLCSTDESYTQNVAVAGSIGVGAGLKLGGTFTGWKLNLAIGAGGSASIELKGSFNMIGDREDCASGTAGLQLQGFVRILWFEISMTVVDMTLIGGIGRNCSPSPKNHDKLFWTERNGDKMFPKFRPDSKIKERNIFSILTEHGWKPVLGRGAYKFDVMSTRRFNSVWASSNKILRRKCDDCIESHQDIYYRRMIENENLEEFDLFEIIKEYFNSGEAISNNKFGIDFKLYSTYEDALSDTNSWKYCDVAASDDEIVGFPSKCSPSEDILAEDQWSVIADRSNLAYGRPVYSSDKSDSFSLKFIRDGIKVVENESESYRFEPESYITINLEENAKLSHILLFCTDVDYNFKIQVLDDQRNPTNEINYSREEVYSWPERIELPGEGQFVRIYNNHEKFITLVEVEVFGVMSKYSRSDIGGQENVAFYVETGATGCILYDIDAMAFKVQNNETLTDDDLKGCDDLVEDDLNWNDEDLTCEETNHQCGFITTISGTKDCGACSEGSFCGPSNDGSGTSCQCTPGVQICQRGEDKKGQIGYCMAANGGNGEFEMTEECAGSCSYNELGQPSCANICVSKSVFDVIPQELRMENDDFVSFRTTNNDPVTCWFSYYVKDEDYRFGIGKTIESCQEECMEDKECVGIEFSPNRSSDSADCALWLQGACFSEDSPGRFMCPNASAQTYVRSEAICKHALPCLTTVDASDLEIQDDVCEDRECWDNKFHYKHCKIMDDCEDSYCRNLDGSPFRVCVDKVSGKPIRFPIELPTESPTAKSPTESPVPPDKKSKAKKHDKKSKETKNKKTKSTK